MFCQRVPLVPAVGAIVQGAQDRGVQQPPQLGRACGPVRGAPRAATCICTLPSQARPLGDTTGRSPVLRGTLQCSKEKVQQVECAHPNIITGQDVNQHHWALSPQAPPFQRRDGGKGWLEEIQVKGEVSTRSLSTRKTETAPVLGCRSPNLGKDIFPARLDRRLLLNAARKKQRQWHSFFSETV